MKQIIVALFIFFSFSSNSFAQTKLIAHKSHSGSKTTFEKSLSSIFFSNPSSNFGMAPYFTVENAQLDSLIYISDSLVILVTSDYQISNYDDSVTVWQPGREYVTQHDLFFRNHSLDSIKSVLKNHYNFQNDIEDVIFIGYDNRQKCFKKGKRN